MKVPNITIKLLRYNKAGTLIRWQSNKISPLKYTVPSLNQTVDKYLKYLQPLVNDSEMNYTKKLVDKFIHSGGEGEILQNLLLEKAEKSENWLSDWWQSIAYLDCRVPIVINSNPGVRFPIEKFKSSDDWITYSANFLSSILKFKLIIDEGKVKQEFIKEDPLCMSQYYTLFSSCRIPGERRDGVFLGNCHLSPVENRSNFITVVHKNRFFAMDVIDRRTQRIYSKEALMRGLYKIIEFSQTKGQPLGLMTAENRNVWATCFNRLNKVPINKNTFSMIQNSLLLFCLDSPVLTSSKQADNLDSIVANNMLHGNGHKVNSANRWFDKTIQVIVSSDGACGMNYEHTPAEAPPLISIIDFVFSDIRLNAGSSGNEYNAEICPLHELEFTLDHQTRQEIDGAKTNISSLVNDLELHAMTFNEFGKSKIKTFKVSPDAFIQVGIQLGYYNMHHSVTSTYESGSLRRYKLGRTDTIRTCSPEVAQFCKSMTDPSVSDSDRKAQLLGAIDQNTSYTKQVLQGQGIDRHLLGLKMIALEHNRQLPEIFMDTSYAKATHHKLSTSQGASSVVDLTMCYGPSVPDGYGFCYNPQREKITYCVSAVESSPDTCALTLSGHIQTAWRSMSALLSQ